MKRGLTVALGVILAVALLATALPFGGFASQSQALAQEARTW